MRRHDPDRWGDLHSFLWMTRPEEMPDVHGRFPGHLHGFVSDPLRRATPRDGEEARAGESGRTYCLPEQADRGARTSAAAVRQSEAVS